MVRIMLNEQELKTRLDIRKACYVDPIYHVIKVRINSDDISGVSTIRNLKTKTCHEIEWVTLPNGNIVFNSVEEIPYQ